MQQSKSKTFFWYLTATLSALVFSHSSVSFAQDLNVCAGESELPFSNSSKEGFENDIAQLVGKSLNRKVNFVWWSNAMTVGKDLNEKKCDLIVGADASDPRLLPTKPYYKSGYVFITKEDRGMDIDSWEHPFLKERNFRIGVMPDSPGKNMLLALNRFDDMFDYFTEIQKYKSTRSRYVRIEPSRVVNDVATEHIHTAVLWAPEAARYVRDSTVPLKMVIAKDTAKDAKGKNIPMHYEVVMGVRKGDEALRDQLNKVIDTKQAEINALLEKEGIPLLPLN